ncbi:MAG: hypothetical protein U9N59_16660 [Campylobacterota bacterium]|nr:hypothetical protein [Campylobacterota bacterium]
MKTYQEKKWIWEDEKFPNFTYKNINLENLNYKFGQLNMLELGCQAPLRRKT